MVQAKQRVEAKSDLEHYLYSMRNQLKDKNKMGGKLSAEDKSKAEKAVQEALDWLDKNADADKKAYEDRKSKVEELLQPIVSKIYKTQDDQQEQGQGGPRQSSPPKSDKTGVVALLVGSPPFGL